MYHLNNVSGTGHPDGYWDCARGKECLKAVVFFPWSDIAHNASMRAVALDV